MTLQFYILTNMPSGQDDEGNIILNVFRGSSREFVLDNWEEAEEYYGYVWKSFLSIWYYLYDKGEIDIIPPPGSDKLEI